MLIQPLELASRNVLLLYGLIPTSMSVCSHVKFSFLSIATDTPKCVSGLVPAILMSMLMMPMVIVLELVQQELTPGLAIAHVRAVVLPLVFMLITPPIDARAFVPLCLISTLIHCNGNVCSTAQVATSLITELRPVCHNALRSGLCLAS